MKKIVGALVAFCLAAGPGTAPCSAQRVRASLPAAPRLPAAGSRLAVSWTKPLPVSSRISPPLLAGTALPRTLVVSPVVVPAAIPVSPAVAGELASRGEAVGRALEALDDAGAGPERLSEEARRLIEGPIKGQAETSAILPLAESFHGDSAEGRLAPIHGHHGRGLHAPEAAQEGSNGGEQAIAYRRALKWALAIGSVFAAIEFAGGMITGSLSLKADAMHLTADLAVTAMALLSVWMTGKPPSAKRTYGNLKMEALTGLLSAGGIAALSLYTLTEAVPRLWEPAAIPGAATIAIAFAGLAANLTSTFLLYKHRDANLTLKGAFLHAAVDALGSVGIIAGSALMLAFGWYIVDPIVGIMISGLIAKTVWQLGHRSWDILMDSVPEGMDVREVRAALAALPGVAEVLDLRLWSLDSNTPALTARLRAKPGVAESEVLKAARELSRRHGVRQSTIEVEPAGATSR